MSFAVLLAGGIGSRLAPLSTPERPKQVLPLLDDGRTPLGATWDRVKPMFGPDRVLVVTGRPMERAVREVLPELPDDAFLVEPEGRNTLPALVWAAAEVHRRGGDRLVSLHADHRVDDDAAFLEAVGAALAFAERGGIALVGLEPTWANPGLGWIVPDGERVGRFVEKPEAAVAERLMAGGALWNLGLFALRVSEVEALPGFSRLAAGEAVESVYGDLDRVSVDHGLIEKTEQLWVSRGSFGWSDLGTWEAIGREPPA